MDHSDKLNGYWEEGYHYYLEFRGDKLTVRNYRREICLETTVSYDADALENGMKTLINLKDCVLSRTAAGEPFTWIKELVWENGELKLLYYYTIMGETIYTLKKKENGPFDHIIIRDDELLPSLQGEWIRWNENGDKDEKLTVNGRQLTLPYDRTVPFHVISYTYDRKKVLIVPENLTSPDFGSYTSIEVCPDMLLTRMIIFDASSPLLVFAREEKVGSIIVPAAAREPIRSTMMHTQGPLKGAFAEMNGMVSRPTVAPVSGEDKIETAADAENIRCPECGANTGADHGKFCQECGAKLI